MGWQPVVGSLPWAFPLVIFRSVTGEPKWEVNHLQIFLQIVIYGMEAENTKAGNICQPEMVAAGSAEDAASARGPGPRPRATSHLPSNWTLVILPKALPGCSHEFQIPTQRPGADTENCKG